MSCRKFAVAATVAILTSLVSPSPPALAAGTCGNKSNFHVGYVTSYSASVYGSSADIEFNNPDLCGSDDTGGSASLVWAMVTAKSASYPNNSDANGYAQVGYGQFGDNQNFIATFSQWTKKCKATLSCGSAAKVETVFDGTNPSGVWRYRVQYEGEGDNHLHMRAEGQELDETSFDPIGDWQVSWQNQFMGETLHVATDVPGTSADKTAFTVLKNQHTSNSSSWTDVDSLTGISGPDRYKREIFGALDFRIWTQPL